jgi:hypothetical protein
LNTHADSLPAAFLRDKLGLEADEKARFENEEALLQSLAHYYAAMPDNRNLAIWDINHYVCRIGGYSSGGDAGNCQVEEILRAIEAYCRYHYATDSNFRPPMPMKPCWKVRVLKKVSFQYHPKVQRQGTIYLQSPILKP